MMTDKTPLAKASKKFEDREEIWGVVLPEGRPLKVLRPPTAQQKLGVSKSTLYAMSNPDCSQYDPEFPKPIRVGVSASGRGAVGWLEHELDAYIQLCALRSRKCATYVHTEGNEVVQ